MQVPNWDYELGTWNQGGLVAGLDEVGRGAFAGPVVVAAVIFKPNIRVEVEINDSKKLSAKKREIADRWIRQNALSYSVSEGSVDLINNKGIVAATNHAFRKSIYSCDLEVKNLLIDAFYIPRVVGFPKDRQIPITKGDQKSISIAAASIVAKVYRDRLMCEFSKQQEYRPYIWQKNKGYGTAAHRVAINQFGASRLHRINYLSYQVRSGA